MDQRVKRITNPDKCEIFARNCEERGHPELALQARQHAVELRAESYGATSDAEREALECVYAYEETLFAKHGRRIRASRTWKMIEDHGILPAIERAVNRPQETDGYRALVGIGLERFAFECVIVRHPEHFDASTIALSKARIESWTSDADDD